jgi:hypothetical protein
MFWILRRTGAVNFFNSINNNYSAKSNSVNVYNNAGKRYINLLERETLTKAKNFSISNRFFLTFVRNLSHWRCEKLESE